ncbi:uncharacterized protein NP_1150A [Natronomonas pharaonis DSM 2160]|uniref:Uncharacterized protein n=1 Tax=Natronomonas pharaonis (strain ATCC 35678 / DSM 2160 / CIP 103997 / JCM 8858 / NBRC 14720 / NCIMB 2260 / Gabara) TaxID=348780 RepID=A0A1U7EUL0_NATPD|nr:hypothetical protein [Natronomonas pharaonis]CAI48666.1 uncharacterized protein NP_1150A [Natronomonas pharaonis DSM 2160]
MTETREENGDDVDTSHLDNVEDGCGCTEIWEHMSDERDDAE